MTGSETTGASKREFVISRTFDAPRDLVWKAWTERERLMRWWGPKGVKIVACDIDFRPGGTFHYGMQMPGGKIMWGKWIFREIVAPERMTVIVAFSDEAGGMTRHPFAPSWPMQTLSNTTFAEENGKTTITVHLSAYNATEEEQKTFDAGHGGMMIGFTGTFDQLAEYLATL